MKKFESCDLIMFAVVGQKLSRMSSGAFTHLMFFIFLLTKAVRGPATEFLSSLATLASATD